jgi:hypothetical protein
MAAVRADVVGQDRLLAVAAILDLQRLEMLVTAPLALAGMRGSSLGYGHGGCLVQYSCGW